MFADPEVDLPSARDLGTAEVVYHTPPNLAGRPAVARWGSIGLSYRAPERRVASRHAACRSFPLRWRRPGGRRALLPRRRAHGSV